MMDVGKDTVWLITPTVNHSGRGAGLSMKSKIIKSMLL